MKARVLIAADHAATRLGVRLALGGGADCSEAVDADEAVAAALREQPDVCVIDFDPPARGIGAAARIAASVPATRVVLLTSRVDEDEFVAAMQAGAVGYLPQRVDPARLPHVVSGVMQGEAAVPRALVARLVAELRGRAGGRPRLVIEGRRSAELTAREWEVVDLLRQGSSTRAIAERLGISAVTVRRHASSGHRKLGVGSRAELLELLGADAAG
jgi:DNA-binding NarL/FixJ family response regulator